jgi:hypothetical protein
MSNQNVISAAKENNVDELRRLIDCGSEIHQTDDFGWTALNWAAGKGNDSAVRLLIERGADVSLTGKDRRTPYMIARSAGHAEVAELLREEEERRGIWKDPRAERPYCRAYKLSELLQYPDFESIATPGVTEETNRIVFVHHDFTVTSSMWHGEDVILTSLTPGWKNFCESTLKFEIPADVL